MASRWSDCVAAALLCGSAAGGCQILLGTDEDRFPAECDRVGDRRCHEKRPQECGEDLTWRDAESCPVEEPLCVLDGLCSKIASVAAGGNHSCAVAEIDGSVRCWGRNSSGELGDGMNSDSSIPVEVIGLHGVREIALGGYDDAGHGCAILSDDTVKCWGNNLSKQLGDGSQENRSEPVLVLGLSEVQHLSLGGRHSCALLHNGTVKCWGWHTTVWWNEPTTIATPDHIVDLSAGLRHTCALTSGGSVYCWGSNDDGQCGQALGPQGGGQTVLIPAKVGGISGVSDVAVGYFHTCAIVQGQAFCWGRNDCGQLGRGDHIGARCPRPYLGGWGDPTPAPATGMPGAGGPIKSMGLGSYHSCFLRSDGVVLCAGRTDYFQAGTQGELTLDHGRPFLPLVTTTSIAHAQAISVGAYHGCVVTTFGSVRCWGRDDYGQLGVPVTVPWQ